MADKEPFEEKVAASKSEYERKLAAWRANGGEAFPGGKEREARQEVKRLAKLEREAKQKERHSGGESAQRERVRLTIEREG